MKKRCKEAGENRNGEGKYSDLKIYQKSKIHFFFRYGNVIPKTYFKNVVVVIVKQEFEMQDSIFMVFTERILLGVRHPGYNITTQLQKGFTLFASLKSATFNFYTFMMNSIKYFQFHKLSTEIFTCSRSWNKIDLRAAKWRW